MKQRDLIKKIEAAGYRRDRSKKHQAYEKIGCRPVFIPNHKEINEVTAQEILKAAGLL